MHGERNATVFEGTTDFARVALNCYKEFILSKAHFYTLGAVILYYACSLEISRATN